MHTARHFRLEFRPVTIPTYFVSYVFPILLVLYELYRVGYWIAQHGLELGGFSEMGYEYTLMLAAFVLQIAAALVFVVWAWLSRRLHFVRRLANLALGLLCSIAVLMFDYGLQSLSLRSGMY